MKKTILLVTVLFSTFYYSQVGINTSNPQGQFTIDAARDNPATGTPSAAQQLNDFTVTSAGNVGIGTNAPTNKVHINGDFRLTDGTQANGKILVSDANGVGTWQDSSPAVIVTSTTGTQVPLAVAFTWIGSSATVTIPGYYLISPRLITDKTPANCGNFIAYNLSKSSTGILNPAFPLQDSHFAPGTVTDFIYSTNVALLEAGTYYMLVRYSGGCTSNTTRLNAGQNSFTLTLLK